MVSALDSGASAPGSSPGRGYCVVFLAGSDIATDWWPMRPKIESWRPEI